MTFALTTPPARPEKWLTDVTPRSKTVTEYWLTQTGLNPITGREGPAQTETVNTVKTVHAAGVDPNVAVPMSYIPGMVLGVTSAKMSKLISSGEVPYVLKGTSKMVLPSDVAAALERERAPIPPSPKGDSPLGAF